MNKNLKTKLASLPLHPGCYLMKDENLNVIYVGKAKKLKNRVNSYFIGVHDYKTSKLVSNIYDFDFIVCQSEKEALILEYNLIKKYNPKYNIVFKDDKSYPYIYLDSCDEPYLKVVRVNSKHKLKGKLFGPYPDVLAARKICDILNRSFQTRKCKTLQDKLCLYYHIKQCKGYCIYKFDKKELDEIKNEIVSFLNGNSKNLLKDLKSKMIEASNQLNFELANQYKITIDDINQTLENQTVQIKDKVDFDVFNYHIKDSMISISFLFIRAGKLLAIDKHIDYLIDNEIDYIKTYLYAFNQKNPISKKLYVPSNIYDELYDKFDFEICTSIKGKIKSLLDKAKLNATLNLDLKKSMLEKDEKYYTNLENQMNHIFHKQISTIEMYDISHTSGKQTVASLVVYKNFKKDKNEYRIYKLEDKNNDYESMKEVIYRRYHRLLVENKPITDLLVVDGGKTQINACKQILKELEINTIVIGLVKDEKHNTSYLLDSNLNEIKLIDLDQLFNFFTNMQDEVHRFAINYHKELRNKNTYKSILDNIKGLGLKTRLKLIKHFGSIENIKNSNLDELETILNKKLALKVYNEIGKK